LPNNRFLTPSGSKGCRKCADILGQWLQDNAPEKFTENDFHTILQRAPLTISCNECQSNPCAICIVDKMLLRGK